MKNIVGRVLLLCLLHTAINALSITTKIIDGQSRLTDAVVVGIPFTLYITVDEANATGNNPHFDYAPELSVRKSGVKVTSINGKSTTSYIYTVIATVAKQYTIGPIKLTVNGTTYTGDSVTFSASLKQQLQSSSTSSQEYEPFVRCTIEQEEIFVGQKVRCLLTLFCPANDYHISLKQIHTPQLQGVHFERIDSQKEGVEIVNQRPYKYVEWQFFISVDTPGHLTMPPFCVDYQAEDDTHSSLFAGFSLIFSRNQLKKIYTDPLILTVLPIPPYKGTCPTIIGQFTDLQATINNHMILVGDATILTLRLTGKGNVHSIKHPEILHAPTHIKIYESQVKIEKQRDGQYQSKYFDYIVQGIKKGTATLPAQKLITFDPVTKKHHILKTKPITITIKDSPHLSVAVEDEKDTENKLVNSPLPEKSVSSQNRASFMDPLEHMHADWQPTLFIPDTIFWHFISLLCILFVLYISIDKSVTLFRAPLKYALAYKKARTALKKAEDTNRSDTILLILKTLVADRKKYTYLPTDNNFYDSVCSLLKNEHAVTEWNFFYNKIVEEAYAQQKINGMFTDLWQHTYRWVYRLKKEGL